MSARIEYAADVPPEIRTALEPHLERWFWLLPGWCRRLYVAYSTTGSEEGASLSTAVAPEYRWARLLVRPAWITQPDDTRENDVIHELLHAPLAPMVEMVEDLLKRLLGDDGEAFHGFAQDRWRVAFEGAVQDLARAIQDRISGDVARAD